VFHLEYNFFRPEVVNRRLLASVESTQANKGNALAFETTMDSPTIAH